jgi:predicted HAD superfamily Cof-like phosphohydrolase
MRKLLTFIKRMFFYDEMEDVRAFYEKFKQPISNHPTQRLVTSQRVHERIRFMQEELDEFKEAQGNNNLALMADALIDLVYVAKGTAIEMGLPWEDLWQDVQRANMAKVIGKTARGIDIDVCKPPGWVPPQTEAILDRAEFNAFYNQPLLNAYGKYDQNGAAK